MFVEVLSERFRQAIGQRFGHDRIIIVMLRLEFFRQLVHSDSGSHRETPEVISQRGAFRSNKICETEICLADRLLHLLP